MSPQSQQLANRLTSCTNGFAKSEATGKKREENEEHSMSQIASVTQLCSFSYIT